MNGIRGCFGTAAAFSRFWKYIQAFLEGFDTKYYLLHPACAHEAQLLLLFALGDLKFTPVHSTRHKWRGQNGQKRYSKR
jgi:hypothetical protein